MVGEAGHPEQGVAQAPDVRCGLTVVP
jgi:hypothetical protein